MRTQLWRLVLAAVFGWCMVLGARAQNAPPPPATGGSGVTLDKLSPISPNPLGVSTNIELLQSFDSEVPLKTTIETLANNAGLKFRYAPELMTDNQPAAVLTAQVGAARWENMTAFEALLRLLRQHSLVLGKLQNTSDVLIGTKESKLTPVMPAGPGGDLDAGSTEAEMDVFGDTGAEMPLQTAVYVLAKLAKISVIFDPKLKLGGTRVVGTNVVEIPPLTNAVVNLGSLMGTPKQRMDTILNAYDLQLIELNPGNFMVSYKEPGAKEPLVPNVLHLKYSNTTNIQDLIQSAYPAPTAKVRADTRTASLLIVSTMKDFENISNLVAKLDTPTKQVLIEARFLETLQNPKSVKGLDWTDTLSGNRVTFGNGKSSGDASAANPFQSQVDNSSTTTTPTTTPNGRPGPSVTTAAGGAVSSIFTTLNPASPGFTANTMSGFHPATAFLNSDGVNVVLSALNTDADTRTLATPRAVTLDNQETRLEVTRAIPIFDQSEGIGQGGTVTSSSKPSYTNVGTILMVTPRISGTNISMRLKPEISKVEAQPSRKVVAGKVNEADIFATSKIDTQVVIPSGNTLVMGGLVSDSTIKTYSKVPLLGDIPVLGWAFRHESKDRSKANLIIFVTPTIVYDEDFQPYRTEFLNTKMPEHPRVEEGPADSGKPAVFGKKAKAKAAEEAEGNALISK